MTYDKPTTEVVDGILSELEEDEVAVFYWLMDEIRERFGKSDQFDPNSSKFGDLAESLASRVL
jgi:hypothetical protein